MAIQIPPKFGFKVEPDNYHRLSVSERLKAWSKELDDDRTNIKPHLGSLFQYYRDKCLIFMPDKEFGRFGVMVYCRSEHHYDQNLLEKYDQVGEILVGI